jgi:hypothetical protein
MRLAAFVGTVLSLFACVSAQAQSSPYYREAPAVAPPPAPGVPPLPQWKLQPAGAKPVMGAVDAGPGLDGPNVHDLDARGYVEQEYFLSGTGHVYTSGGQGIAQADVPYVTRILVRRPKDPEKFSGNVVIEPSRDVNEWTTTWPSAAPYMLGHGDIFVAFTMAKANLPVFFHGYDKDRYAALSIPDEGLRWDIMAQTAALMRSPAGPLGETGFLAAAQSRKGGLKVISTGTSLTGNMQSAFIDNGHHARARRADGGPVMDGYLILVAGRPKALPRDAAVIAVVAEGDMARNAARLVALRAPDADGPLRFRWYEIAGTGHANWEDQSQFTPAFQLIGAKAQSTVRCALPVSETAAKVGFTSAALSNLQVWLRDGTPPPPGAVLEIDADGAIKRDAHGNALGGVRPHWVAVPVSTILPVSAEAEGSAAIQATGGLCSMFPTEQAFPAAVRATLYKNRAAYIAQVERHLRGLVAMRYLLAEGQLHQMKQVEAAAW